MERNHRFLSIAIALVVGLVSAHDVDACSCSGWTRLEQMAEVSDAVLVGRVVFHFSPGDPKVGRGPSVYMYVQVLESIKGSSKGLRIRVWDSGWGGPCPANLSQFPKGAIVGLALERNKPKNGQNQGPHGLTIEPGDFLMGPCAEYGRVMASLEEGQEFVARVTKGAKKGK